MTKTTKSELLTLALAYPESGCSGLAKAIGVPRRHLLRVLYGEALDPPETELQDIAAAFRAVGKSPFTRWASVAKLKPLWIKARLRWLAAQKARAREHARAGT